MSTLEPDAVQVPGRKEVRKWTRARIKLCIVLFVIVPLTAFMAFAVQALREAAARSH